jgi:SAM-dependent methyltransferase
MTEDDELLSHYLRCGAEPWNSSLESAWLEYELRAWAMPLFPSRRPLNVCNIGIGVGTWDDWLGHVLGISITSVDRDPDVCRMLELRQRREGHPHPARVIHGDVLDGVLGVGRFDVIVAVGSTIAEADNRDAFDRASRAALAPGGRLLLAEAGTGQPPEAYEVKSLGDVWLAFSAP